MGNDLMDGLQPQPLECVADTVSEAHVWGVMAGKGVISGCVLPGQFPCGGLAGDVSCTV